MNREPVSSQHAEGSSPPRDTLDVQQTTCCVVGGGPAGATLSFMLARQGIPVILLESHLDFDRDFRGDTLHPSILEVMDELGLADRLLQLPHTELSLVTPPAAAGPQLRFDLHELKTKFPYIAMMPQTRFLEFITSEAQRFPSFRLVMGARVEELLEEDGQVRGVRYRAHDGWHEVRALLTVGTDGRFSRLRKLAGFEPIASSPPMDVLWLRLSRKPDDPHGLMARFGHGRALIFLEREDHWQIGYVIGKGTYQQVRAAGLEALRQAIAETAPEFAGRVAELKDWKQVSMLSVEANRLPRWYRPGLLLLGDAAHVMSPAGGNGINYAVMDAVAAANILTAPLQAGQVTVADLARVQRRRELPTRVIQTIVNFMQDRLLKAALDPNGSFTFPSFLGWPFVRKLPPLLFGFGIRPEHVQTETRRGRTQALVGWWVAAFVVTLVAGWAIRRLLRRF
ncbi:MAG: FAD-dependent oxidoreductase [Chloroflexi bacterium]|nr:MAG: FAD-dependent oxidoreductase [Chloroflexota bacterium]